MIGSRCDSAQTADMRCFRSHHTACKGHCPGFIYVARVALRGDAASDGWPLGWKIGYTENLTARVAAITWQCGWAALVALMPGTRDDEQAIHKSLARLRTPGPHPFNRESREWYANSAELRAWERSFPAVWRGWVTCRLHPHKGKGRTSTRVSSKGRIHRAWMRAHAAVAARMPACPAATFNATTEAT